MIKMEHKPPEGHSDEELDEATAALLNMHEEINSNDVPETKHTHGMVADNKTLAEMKDFSENNGEEAKVSDRKVDSRQKKQCQDNIDALQYLIKESESKFSDISDILVTIINSEGKTLMDHSATMQLDMMADDLVTIKSKITYIESNLGVLRSDVISGKNTKLAKQEFSDSHIKSENYTAENYTVPKMEVEDYLDEQWELDQLAQMGQWDKDYEDDGDGDDDDDEDYVKPVKPRIRSSKIRSSSGGLKYTCDICNKKVKSIAKHKEMVHNTLKTIPCDLCHKKFKTRDVLENHKRKIHKQANFKCHSCNHNLPTLYPLRKHLFQCHEHEELPFVTQMNTGVIKWLCSKKVCNFEADSVNDVKQHMKNQHQKNIDTLEPKVAHEFGEMKCQFCNYSKLATSHLKTHMMEAHGVVKRQLVYVTELLNPEIKHWLCTFCNFSSTSAEARDIHALKHSDENEADTDLGMKQEEDDTSAEVMKCPKAGCDYKTRSQMCFQDHVNGDLRFRKCPFCDKHFPMKDHDFLKHIAQHGGWYDEVKKHWLCSHCPSTFKRKQFNQFLSHIYCEHKIGTPYHCYKCDFMTGSYENIARHSTVHTESAIPCPHCSFIAKSKQRLSKHICAKHKSYECVECNIKFNVKKEYHLHLQDHAEVSPGEEKSICDHCGSIFNSHKELFLHKIKIRKDQSVPPSLAVGEFYCPICNVKCSRVHALARHMKDKHSQGETTIYECQEPGCAYTTPKKHGLKIHVEKVHLGIRWPCDLCKFVGSYKADLNRHIKIVHDGFSLTCNQCDFQSPHQYVMNKHKENTHAIHV